LPAQRQCEQALGVRVVRRARKRLAQEAGTPLGGIRESVAQDVARAIDQRFG
jgi:hypothetical protein